MKNDRDTGLDRIARLEEQMARALVNSGRRRQLTHAIRIETDLYRKSLDAEQADATHDVRPAQAVAGLPLDSAPSTRSDGLQ